MLRAYFDESGTHNASVVTAMGGYVATEADWISLEREWNAILGEVAHLGVTHFHLCDCLMGEGEFARCDTPTRNYVLTQLSKIAGSAKRNLTPIMSAVVQDDWDELNDGGAFFQAFPTPVALCFENLVRELVMWAKDHAGGEKVAPVFAYRQEWATGEGLGAPILQLYGSQDWYKQRLAKPGFGWPQNNVALQAADLIAGLSRREVDRRDAHNPHEEQAHAWAAGGKFTHGSWFDRDALKITIERFNATGEIYSVR